MIGFFKGTRNKFTVLTEYSMEMVKKAFMQNKQQKCYFLYTLKSETKQNQ